MLGYEVNNPSLNMLVFFVWAVLWAGAALPQKVGDEILIDSEDLPYLVLKEDLGGDAGGLVFTAT